MFDTFDYGYRRLIDYGECVVHNKLKVVYTYV